MSPRGGLIRTLGGPFGELPLYLRAALKKYAREQVEAQHPPLTLDPLILVLECEEVIPSANVVLPQADGADSPSYPRAFPSGPENGC